VTGDYLVGQFSSAVSLCNQREGMYGRIEHTAGESVWPTGVPSNETRSGDEMICLYD
jgi:hypothetical protein